jgi:CDP-diacylglycerol---serine O-phosphatidyltransferase
VETDRPRVRDRSLPFLREVPIRVLAPNLVTLVALCSGLTAIRLSLEGQLQWALAAIIFAAVLDGVDGRLARLLKGTSRFGAELDSLTDFVNFGVAPAILLYTWLLRDAGHIGWVACLLFAIACGLRLARFNVALDDPDKPAWAGAIVGLLPVYVELWGVPHAWFPAWLVLPFTLFVAFMMVSRVPIFSGKTAGVSIGRDKIVFLLAGVAGFLALLVSYPWPVMTICTLIYLGSIPFGMREHARLTRADAERASTPGA